MCYPDRLAILSPVNLPGSSSPDLSMLTQLWYATPELLCDRAIDHHCRSLLPDDELAQAARFRQPQHQRQHVLTRHMVRHVLGEMAGVSPRQLVFGVNRYGKPHVAWPADFRWSFNISHCTGMVVCAVSEQATVGVDIEPLDREVNVDLADRYFAGYEAAALRQRPVQEQPFEFLRYWTLKEAFIKALGTGLATPLADFAFDLTAAPQPVLRFVQGPLPPPRAWKFAQFTLDQHWLVALAHQSETPLECELRDYRIQ